VVDDDEIGKVARVEKKPEPVEKEQPDEWVNGLFSLRELDDIFPNSTDVKEYAFFKRIKFYKYF
jgi:hypothetical protein